MKIFYFISVVMMCASTFSIAEELVVPQPEFPKMQQEKQLSFSPPKNIGELPEQEQMSFNARRDDRATDISVPEFSLANDGKIIIINISSQE